MPTLRVQSTSSETLALLPRHTSPTSALAAPGKENHAVAASRHPACSARTGVQPSHQCSEATPKPQKASQNGQPECKQVCVQANQGRPTATSDIQAPQSTTVQWHLSFSTMQSCQTWPVFKQEAVFFQSWTKVKRLSAWDGTTGHLEILFEVPSTCVCVPSYYFQLQTEREETNLPYSIKHSDSIEVHKGLHGIWACSGAPGRA